MKVFLSSECRNIAKNFNIKMYKQEFDTLITDVMFLINEASKRGDFSVDIETEVPEKLRNTFLCTIKDLGYTITVGEVITITWG